MLINQKGGLKMKKRKLAVAMAAVMSLSLAFSACDGGSTNTNTTLNKQMEYNQTIKATNPDAIPAAAKSRKDTLVIGELQPDGLINQLYCSGSYDYWIAELCLDPFVSVAPDGSPAEGIAKKWDVSSDGLTYTFYMRDGIKYQDGTTMTADDVLFTFQVLCDSSYSGSSDYTVYDIKGADEYNKGKASTISGIQVVDNKTIKITLNNQNAPFLYNMEGFPVLSRAYYGKDYKQGNTKCVEDKVRTPLSYGQYVLTKFMDGQEADLVANPNYWRGAPKIKNVVFKVVTDLNAAQNLSAGNIDMYESKVTPETVSTYSQPGFCNLITYLYSGYGYIGYNCADGATSEQKVRQALTYATDRELIDKTVYQQYYNIINEPCAPSSQFYNKDVESYKFDMNKAAKLLDEAGWKKGSDGVRVKNGNKLSIHFLASSPNDVLDKLIPIIKQDYEKLGVDLVSEEMEFNQVLKKIKSTSGWNMYFMANPLSPDPDVTSSFGSKSPSNYQHFKDDETDKLLKNGLQEIDKTKRIKIYQDLWKRINEQHPIDFIYQRKNMDVVSAKITGLEPTTYQDFTFTLYKASIK